MMTLPIYIDGCFHLYEIKGKQTYDQELVDQHMEICFRENGIGDSLKAELKQSGISVTTKITIPQYRKISPKNVLLIDGEYHRVYNSFHVTDKDGNRETNLTLERYVP